MKNLKSKVTNYKKPVLTDYYDQSDPRGCSTHEYNDFKKAYAEWEKSVAKTQSKQL